MVKGQEKKIKKRERKERRGRVGDKKGVKCLVLTE